MALVQSLSSFPPSSTALMRPSSSPGTSFAAPSPSQPSQPSSRSSPMPRNVYNTPINTPINTSYRGNAPHAATAPYAFTSTPATAGGAQQQPQSQYRPENRPLSSMPVSNGGAMNSANSGGPGRQHYPQNASVSTSSSSASSTPGMSKDDSSLPNARPITNRPARPLSSVNLTASVSGMQTGSPAGAAKPSPDRYRRVQRRPENNPPANQQQNLALTGSAMPSGSGMATVGHLYNHPMQASSSPSLQTYASVAGSLPSGRRTPMGYAGPMRAATVDDIQLYRQAGQDAAQRYRRRSISSLNAAEYDNVPAAPMARPRPSGPSSSSPAVPTARQIPQSARPASSHGRNGSAESQTSVKLSQATTVKQEQTAPMSYAAALQSKPIARNEPKLVNIPPRGSSDANKRLTGPSPLSRPVAPSPEQPKPVTTPSTPKKSSPPPPSSSARQDGLESPAAQQLAALTDKDTKKGVKSRLRRAFSFGSAAELRRASAENSMNNQVSQERARLRKERFQEEQEAEQAAIAQKQEEGGIGESIYSGQGHFFTGSTDNLSISSTASSASVMIRKMGKGMKKSTRSLVGLFRPKSVVGVPPMDSAIPEVSTAQVSMVTVEAEREKVNVNANPHDQVGGGTGFPRLERNSLDAANATSDVQGTSTDGSTIDDVRSRRSIVGGEKERAEVLAAVKKGILKRSGTESGNSSPVTRPADKTMDFNLPQIPHVNDTPGSSAPSTPRSERPAHGHRRTDSVAIEGEDYFMNIPKLSANAETRSMGAISKYNVSFSPRIQFHDTWPSMEYDRRGEIATCNRLTPMLAQQIKEELNTFKMEMEVHEQSKVYTHFF